VTEENMTDAPIYTAEDALEHVHVEPVDASAQAAEIERLTRERERLALAICGGEDAPGYANTQAVETLEAEAQRSQAAHRDDIDRMMRAEADRDRLAAEVKALREALADMLSGWRYIRQHHGDLAGVGWDRAEQAARAALAQGDNL
jgi:hypothetical protein